MNKISAIPTERNRIVYVGSILALIIISNYFDTTKVGLVDGDYSILRNLRLLFHGHPDLIASYFSGAYVDPKYGLHFRPFEFFPQALEFLLFGISPPLLHIANVFIHFINSVLVYVATICVFRKLFIPHPFLIAFWSSILFALHPVHAEGVDWWSSIVDITFTTWYLSAIICFTKYLNTTARSSAAGTVIFALLAFGSKESAFTLPAILSVLAICAKSKLDWTNLRLALKETAASWIALILFCAWRAACLGTFIGGYHGQSIGKWFSTFYERFIQAAAFQKFWYPLSSGGANDWWLGNCFSAAYLLIAAIFIRNIVQKKQNAFKLRPLVFAGLFLAVSTLPASYAWHPDTDMNGTRLLYLPCLGFCWLTCLMVFGTSNKTGNWLRHLAILLLACACIVSLSTLHSHWILASDLASSLINQLRDELRITGQQKKLVLITLPNRIFDVSVFYSFSPLQQAMKEPFAAALPWSSLLSLEPHYFGDTTVVNLSRIRQLASATPMVQAYDCTLDMPNHRVELRKFDLSRFKALDLEPSMFKAPAPKTNPGHGAMQFPNQEPAPALADLTGRTEAIILPAQRQRRNEDIRIGQADLTKSSIQQNIYYTARLPHTIDSACYQFLQLHLASPIGPECRTLRIFWKSAKMKEFTDSMSRNLDPNRWRNQSDINIHIGELLDWLRCNDVDSIAIASNEDIRVTSCELKDDATLVPRLAPYLITDRDSHTSAPPAGETNGGEILPNNGTFQLSFDASNIPNAKKILVEVAHPDSLFNARFNTFRENKTADNPEESFILNSLKGKLSIADRQPTPTWRQARIMALNARNEIIGYSSDPVYLLSRGSEK